MKRKRRETTRRRIAFHAFVDLQNLRDSVKLLTPWHFWLKIKTVVLMRLRYMSVKGFVNTQDKILDVGGEIRTNIGHYVSNKVITVNIKRNAHPTIVASATNLPIVSKSFKLATCLQTFHQIRDERVVLELKRVTTDRIIIHDYDEGESFQMLKRLLPDALRIRSARHYMPTIADLIKLHPQSQTTLRKRAL